jgi:predicted secreted protein
MAKLTLTRFPDPRENYEREQYAELIRQLEDLVQQLNSSYTQDTQEESTRRSWFFSNG